MSQNGDNNETPFRSVVRLRRTQNEIQPEVVQNLQSLSRKKRTAQELYYGGVGQSPLTRSIARFQHTNKPPVHERLGRKKIILRQMNVSQNNLPLKNRKRLRLRRNNANQSFTTPMIKRNTFKSRYSAQPRLQKIQQQGVRDALQSPQLQTIRLQRRLVEDSVEPMNYTVQINNSAFRKPTIVNNYKRHSVQDSLTPQLQADIRALQNQSQFEPEIILEDRIFVPGYGVSKITCHQRFSQL